MTLEYINDCIKQYSKQLTEPIINNINNSTKLKYEGFYHSQYHNNTLDILIPISNLIVEIGTENYNYIRDTYDKKYQELKKYNRSFKLLPKHLYNSLYNPNMDCPCCLDNIDKNKFEMTICGHPICSVCLYNLPNNKCPTCKSIIE